MKTAGTGKFRHTALGCSVLAIMLAASPALAQLMAATDKAQSEEDIIVRASRAVTATKTDTPLIQIPQSITIVTSQQIRDQGALTMLSAMDYTAGATDGGDDTRGDFVNIRGFLAVNYLDGLKREFGFVYLPRSEVYALDRIDVLLGPSAVLYGAGSSGGLVNMESKRPQFQFGGEATVSYGSYDRKQAQFDITGPISDTVAVRLVGLYRDSDMLLHYLPDNRTVIQPSITWKPNDKTNVTLIGLFQRDYTGPVAYMPLAATLYAPDGRRMKRSTLLGEPDFNKGPKNNKELTLLIDHQFSDAIKFHSGSRIEGDHTRYGEIYGTYYLNPLDPFLNEGDSVISRSLFAYKAHYRSLDTDNNIELDFRTGPFTHKILGGVEYSHFRQLAQQAYQDATPIDIYDPVYGAANIPDYGPRTRQVLIDTGFYAQDQIRFEDRASLVLGIRHDHLKSENSGLPTEIDNATTLRAGLTVDVTKKLSPYVSYSESFQPVSGLNQFNESYKPLYGKSYEGGVKWAPLRGAMIRLTYYDIVERNHLVPDPSNPLNSIQTGKVKSKGVEFQANYDVAQDLTISVAYAHNKTRVTGENHQQDNSPRDTASIFGTKTVRLGDDMSLRIGGGVRYVGSQVSGDKTYFQVVTPHYTLVDAIAALDFRHWTVQINARNLLDKYYYAACSQYGSCTNGDARTVDAALTYHF